MLCTAFFGGAVVLASVPAALAGLVLARRLVPLRVRERHTTATGTIYAAVYVMFGLSVEFSLFSVCGNNSIGRARRPVEKPPAWKLSTGLPEAEEGWPLLEQGRLSPRGGNPR